VLTAACAVALWRSHPSAGKTLVSAPSLASHHLTAGQRLRWLVLAFVPSSLMLSVTTYLTTDIAAIPLLWVIPLALYLLTFVLAFARRPPLSPSFMAHWMPLPVLFVLVVMLTEATEPLIVVVGLHLLLLFWAGMVCHGLLAAHRPAADRLTEYYLWISLGGVAGGVFNALLAPLLFPGIFEYPIVVVLACLLRPAPPLPASDRPRDRAADALWPLVLAVGTPVLILGGHALGLEAGPVAVGAMFGAPLVVLYTFAERPVRFALGLAALLLVAPLYVGMSGRPLYRARSFFGVHRVTLDVPRNAHVLLHGNTIHGMQSLSPGFEQVPLTYYFPTGPMGQVFASLKGDDRLRRVGLVGLGTGALASYAEPGQHWTYYEIDPEVIRIALDQRLFTYLAQCPAPLDFVEGDARLTLGESDERFGLLVLDAFSSDAIPVHLLTREALEVYRQRLSADGVLAINISNRYLDLEPVLARLAQNARPPMPCLIQEDLSLTAADRKAGKSPSTWVVLGNTPDALTKVRTSRWRQARTRPGMPVWTDDFSNLLSVFRWE
jgi:spermidine synthase